IQKVVLALKARKAAKAAKDSVLRKGALEGMTLPGKLADCQSRSAEESELFIVEGDSAGGTAKMGRDRRTQAILPLRGKILNIERARLDRMLASEQIKNLVVAFGTAIGDTFDIEKLRYHKIIIATDADVDGAHIRTLLLTLLYRFFRPLIDSGYVYIAQPPLYKIKQGKEISFAYTDAEKNKILGTDVNLEDLMEVDGEENNEEESSVDELEAESLPAGKQGSKLKARNSKPSIQRYKGLGEMNAEELWETTMDPKVRVLKQVNVADARDADRIFDILMGTDVPSRKSFIQSNAKSATLDI
ncbi:DNA topoisomerase IV subunit B, partial [Candidatus Parcubacteria bacterium]|nr:DNA topoisomerase IV subunit B [Candidatus Parcubacteria bacterium]